MQLNKLHFSVDLLFLSSPTGHKEEAGVFQYKHVLLSISFTPYPIPSNFQKKIKENKEVYKTTNYSENLQIGWF